MRFAFYYTKLTKLYETNEIYVQKLWSSSDEEMIDPLAQKEFHRLSVTPHLVESSPKFLKWAIDFSNLEFSVTLHSQNDNQKNETDICYDYGRIHYHLVFYSVKFPKTMDKLIKKIFNTALLETMVGSHSSYKIEMFSTASAASRKEFLRITKILLAYGPTIQRHFSELNHVNTRSNVDCIWEKSQAVRKSCNDGHVMKQAQILDKLERSSSQFKHSVTAIIDFLARNSYGKFTTTEHSCTLNVSLELAKAQCDCDECFLIHNEERDEQQSINSEKFQYKMKEPYFLNIQFMINFPRKQSVVTMYPDYYTVKQVIKIFDKVKRLFPENPTSKNAFLAVCKVISSDKDLKVINSECEYGG